MNSTSYTKHKNINLLKQCTTVTLFVDKIFTIFRKTINNIINI